MSPPILGSTQTLWVQELESGRLSGFYASERLFATAGTSRVKSVRVELIADEVATPEDYWAWWEASENRFLLVWPERVLLEMCFGNGMAAETKRGRGQPVRVRVHLTP